MKLTNKMLREAENMGELETTEETDFDVLEENTPDLISELQDEYTKIKTIGDELTNMSQEVTDIDMKSILVELGSSAYTLALDIQDAGETFQEIAQEEAEQAAEDLEASPEFDNLEVTGEEAPPESEEELELNA